MSITEGEINRLKELPDNYDRDLFNQYFKSMTPLIKKLIKQIDEKRFNVPRDVVQSWFYDKLLYVFNKYYNLSTENPEKFKATIISSLMTYKNRVLRNAYSKQSTEFLQTMDRWDDCFDGDKGDLKDSDEDELQMKSRLEDIYEFMRRNCSPDAYLLFQIQMNPPLYIINKLKTKNAIISTALILEYFEKPINQSHISYITQLRKEISSNINLIKEKFQ